MMIGRGLYVLPYAVDALLKLGEAVVRWSRQASRVLGIDALDTT